MSKPKRVRWVCPNDAHPGVLGPRQPRMDSLVRYCLPCSQEAGRLVQRVAPALERQRQEAAERAKAKDKARRQRAARQRQEAKEADAQRYVTAGVDLRAELQRLVRLRAFGGPQGPLTRMVPKLTVTHRSRKPSTRLGSALLGSQRIHMAIYPGQTAAMAKEVLLHELVHLHVGTERVNGRRVVHGDRFRSVMRQAFREAYGPDVITHHTTCYVGHFAAALVRQEQAQAAATTETR